MTNRSSRFLISVDQQRGALRGGPHRLCIGLIHHRRPPPSAASATEVVQRRSARLFLLRRPAQLAPAEHGKSAVPPEERHPRPRGQDLGCQRGRKRQTGCARDRFGSVLFVIFCIVTRNFGRGKLNKLYETSSADRTYSIARPKGPWDDDGKVHHGPESLPSGKNQTRHLDALDAADKTAAYEGGGGGGGATIIFRVGRVGLEIGPATHSLTHPLDPAYTRPASGHACVPLPVTQIFNVDFPLLVVIDLWGASERTNERTHFVAFIHFRLRFRALAWNLF